MKIGDKFASYEVFQAALTNYKKDTNNEFWLRDCRTIQNQRNRNPDTVDKINPTLKYYYMRLACIKGGRPFVSKNKKSKRKCSSCKQECPATIFLKVSNCKQFLCVLEVNDNHNHTTSSAFFNSLARQRKTTSLQTANPSCQAVEMFIKTETVFVDESFDVDTMELDDKSVRTNSQDVTKNIPVETYSDPLFRPSSALSTSSSSQSIKSTSSSKSKKFTPELNTFATRRKINEQAIDNEIAKADSAISAAMTSMSTIFTKQNEHDAYMLCIGECLKHVPNRNRTQCLIEVLQVIQKYEERSCRWLRVCWSHEEERIHGLQTIHKTCNNICINELRDENLRLTKKVVDTLGAGDDDDSPDENN